MKNGMIVDKIGVRYWYLHDKLHRSDGPAVEKPNGDKYWYLHGKLHREDGPAVELSGGDKAWWVNGLRHREDGPAIEWANGDKMWWLDGRKIGKKEVQQILQQQLAQETQQQLAQETQKKLASSHIDIAPDSVTFDMIEQCDDYGAKLQLIESYGLDQYWNEKVARN